MARLLSKADEGNLGRPFQMSLFLTMSGKNVTYGLPLFEK
jgi:hypothetical protein